MKTFTYREVGKYRFETLEAYTFSVAGLPDIDTEYITIRSGRITIAPRYAWDGATGWPKKLKHPKCLIQSSLVHDAIYQLMREGKIDRKKWRKYADRMLQLISIEDGMNVVLAAIVYRVVRIAGKKSTMPEKKHRGRTITIKIGSNNAEQRIR